MCLFRIIRIFIISSINLAISALISPFFYAFVFSLSHHIIKMFIKSRIYIYIQLDCYPIISLGNNHPVNLPNSRKFHHKRVSMQKKGSAKSFATSNIWIGFSKNLRINPTGPSCRNSPPFPPTYAKILKNAPRMWQFRRKRAPYAKDGANRDEFDLLVFNYDFTESCS